MASLQPCYGYKHRSLELVSTTVARDTFTIFSLSIFSCDYYILPIPTIFSFYPALCQWVRVYRHRSPEYLLCTRFPKSWKILQEFWFSHFLLSLHLLTLFITCHFGYFHLFCSFVWLSKNNSLSSHCLSIHMACLPELRRPFPDPKSQLKLSSSNNTCHSSVYEDSYLLLSTWCL